MNAPATSSRPRHRIWPWILGLILTPFVVLGVLIAGVIHLNSDAAALRRQVMAATGNGWHTKVQFSVGPVLLGAVRTGVSFIRDMPPEAREALRAVRSASVGVYARSGAKEGGGRRDEVFATADRLMARRGWTRIVGVADTDNIVLIYLPTQDEDSQPSRVCLAVCNDRELVVVAAGFEAKALAGLIAREMDGRLPVKL
jgi:hypothetical protein